MKSAVVMWGTISFAALVACANTPIAEGDLGYPSDDAGSGGGLHGDSGAPASGGDNGGGTTHPGSDDGGGSPAATDAGQATTSDAGATDCLAAVTPEFVGKHNEGSNCMQSQCHDGSNGAPHWTIAGTLYNASTGVVPVIGATIEVTDAKGKVVAIATSFDGNFHTTESVTFPVSVRASSCPNDARMMAKVSSTESCNQNGCHDSAMRMHLP